MARHRYLIHVFLQTFKEKLSSLYAKRKTCLLNTEDQSKGVARIQLNASSNQKLAIEIDLGK
ncbi:MAG: hypothetical protein C5B54_01235 [Acidobacteria bacterium]|nr:MAG: hypothetical protein C5B54_01235 [Acidobacteriota bacterium]